MAGFILNIFIFLVAAWLIWYFAGLLLDSVSRVARKHSERGFPFVFFTLGLLTSVSEMSVTANAIISKTPEVAAGTLIGASIVLILFVIPFLIISAKDLKLKKVISRQNLFLSLMIILMPAVFVLDGTVSWMEGLLILVCYVTLFYVLKSRPTVKESIKGVDEVDKVLVGRKKVAVKDYGKIMLGALIIFLAGHYLVSSSVEIAGFLKVPASLVGLLLISIGTNIPELTIAMRAIRKKHNEIAFADYMGSAVANSFLFAMLPMFSGKFKVEVGEFLVSFSVLFVGVIVFYLFARSKDRFSLAEGWVLLSLYSVFLLMQIFTFKSLAGL